MPINDVVEELVTALEKDLVVLQIVRKNWSHSLRGYGDKIDRAIERTELAIHNGKEAIDASE